VATGSTDIAAVVRRYYESAELKAGDRLPPERELVKILNLNRSEIRRGLAQLDAEGRITRHVGRGTFVAPASPHFGGEASPREILEARRLVEPAIMPLVVANATARDVEVITRCLDESERATTHEEFEVWDSALHSSIVESTKNRLVISIYERITEARNQVVWGNLKRASFTAERRAAYEAHHRTIVGHIVDRDAGAASAKLAEHIHQITVNLLGTHPH
jgi:DNA-binding FadR family transcriptional regulator